MQTAIPLFGDNRYTPPLRGRQGLHGFLISRTRKAIPVETPTPTPQRAGPLAHWPPLAKIAVWCGAILLLAAMIQAAAWTVGLDFEVFSESGGGRGVLLGLAVAVLLLLMGADRRPAADYGLAAGTRWHWKLFGGFVIGAALYGGYCLLALLAGAYTLSFERATPYRCTSAGLSALLAFPVALVQQIIFSGYVLSIFRDRYSRMTAVLCAAFLFGLFCRIDDPASFWSAEPQPLVIGMFLIAALLGILRLQSGSVLLPAGFLAGCIFVRRVVRRTSLLLTADQSEAAAWLAPNSDPRQAPVMWALVTVGIVACAWVLLRRGEQALAAPRRSASVGFKRLYPFSHIGVLWPLDLWLGRLAAARFRVDLRCLPRLAVVLAFSAVNTVLSLPERLLMPVLLRRRRVPDPVFIVGVHRSGTTHLHNLLSLDGQFCAPLAYQTLNPAGFLFTGWLITPVLGAFMPWKRPMDAVRFHLFAPQEEEFAVAGATRLSPYWLMSFPRQVAHYERYAYVAGFTERERAEWKRRYLHFLRKLTFWSRRRPLLKNPYNTARVAMLREMFPRARFIHISRHPYDVYRSNMHLAREGHVVHQLQEPDPADSYQTRFLDNYRAMEEAYYAQTARLPAGQAVEVRFEDLERDPVGQVRRIYARLGLEFTPQFERRLERYLAGVAGYRKNALRDPDEEDRRRIDAAMSDLMARWGYAARAPAAPAERRRAA